MPSGDSVHQVSMSNIGNLPLEWFDGKSAVHFSISVIESATSLIIRAVLLSGKSELPSGSGLHNPLTSKNEGL